MRLESALYASREGLAVHGSAISVVGNNISNANTVAYKTSRAEFAELFSRTSEGQEGTAAPATGNGVKLSRVRTLFEDGAIEQTSRSLDAGISGNGFFIVDYSGANAYTRAGNFQTDADGFLTNADGYRIQGYTGDATDLGDMNLLDVEASAVATSSAAVSGNIDAESVAGTAPTAPTSFDDLRSQSSFTGAVSVIDSLGAVHDIVLAYTRTAPNTWTAQAWIDAGDVGSTAGVPKQLGTNATLTFSTSGIIEDANAAAALITADPAYANGAAAGNIAINLSGMTQFARTSQISNITQNGESGGDIKGYQIDSDGMLYGVLDSDRLTLIGRLPLAKFANVDGLQPIGNSLFQEGATSGERVVANPGEDGAGTLQGGALERSTTDIAGEFVNLVLLQRGYQANSQSMGVANQLLQQTIQLAR